MILGEMHGTAEGPKFVAAAACTALRAGRTIGVALEWPSGVDHGSPSTDAFLSSVDHQDGRRSVAMLELARVVTAWKAQGAAADLLLIDPVDDPRDVGMAARVRAWRDSHPDAVVIVLVGNVHARRVQGWRENTAYTPLAFLLDDVSVTLNMRYGEGAAWNCQRDGCGPHPLAGENADLRVRVEWSGTPGTYDGTWWIGVPTASPPAVSPR